MGRSSILAWGKSRVSCLQTAPFLHYVSTIKYYWSIEHCSLLLFFKSYFCTFPVFVHFSLFKKKLFMDPDHGPLSWTGSMKVVHVPGPNWGSMDPWSMFCPHPLNNGYKNSLNSDAIFFVLYLTVGDWGFFRSELPFAYLVQRSHCRLNFHMKQVWRWTAFWFALVCW